MARDGGGGIGSVLSWGLVVGAGWFLWNWWQSQQAHAAASSPASTAPAASTPTALATSSTPAPGASSVSRLDALYQAMVNAAAKAGYTSTLNPDQWGYYLGQVAGTPAPDALLAFPAYNRASNWPNISAAQYWAGTAPLVAQQMGLSGLGMFGGLGRLAMGRR